MWLSMIQVSNLEHSGFTDDLPGPWSERSLWSLSCRLQSSVVHLIPTCWSCITSTRGDVRLKVVFCVVMCPITTRRVTDKTPSPRSAAHQCNVDGLQRIARPCDVLLVLWESSRAISAEATLEISGHSGNKSERRISACRNTDQVKDFSPHSMQTPARAGVTSHAWLSESDHLIVGRRPSNHCQMLFALRTVNPIVQRRGSPQRWPAR